MGSRRWQCFAFPDTDLGQVVSAAAVTKTPPRCDSDRDAAHLSDPLSDFEVPARRPIRNSWLPASEARRSAKRPVWDGWSR
jgi:hypothetical protein